MESFAKMQFNIQTLRRCDARNPLHSVSSVVGGALKKEIAAAARMLSHVATALVLQFNKLVLLHTEKRLKLRLHVLECAYVGNANARARTHRLADGHSSGQRCAFRIQTHLGTRKRQVHYAFRSDASYRPATSKLSVVVAACQRDLDDVSMLARSHRGAHAEYFVQVSQAAVGKEGRTSPGWQFECQCGANRGCKSCVWRR